MMIRRNMGSKDRHHDVVHSETKPMLRYLKIKFISDSTNHASTQRKEGRHPRVHHQHAQEAARYWIHVDGSRLLRLIRTTCRLLLIGEKYLYRLWVDLVWLSRSGRELSESLSMFV